jgi:hypothetical protein
VRSQAKASSAGPTSGRGRGSCIGVSLLIAVLALLALASHAPAKVIVSGFGTRADGPHAFGGQFQTFTGVAGTSMGSVAVNTSGNGAPAGTAYVADRGGRRVSRFSPNGDFERLWGQDVIAPLINDTQLVTISATEGTYTLTFKGETTDPIPFDSIGGSSGEIEPALAALPAIGGDANIQVSNGTGLIQGNTYLYVVFTGTFAGTDQPPISVDSSQLAGAAEVSNVADGDPDTEDTGTGFEICTVAVQCKLGLGIEQTLFGNGGLLNFPLGIAVDQSNGHVYVSGGTGDARITEFDADGNFIRLWGWDVVRSGGTGDVSGTKEEQQVTINASATGGKFSLSFEGQTTGANGSGKRTSGSAVLTGVSTSSGAFEVGQVITGTGIPANTTIVAVEPEGESASLKKLTLSAPASSGAETSTTLAGHDISWDASPAQVQEALEGIPLIGPGDVSVSSANPGGGVVGGPFTITFQEELADSDVPQLTSSAVGLVAATKTVTVSTTTAGKPGGFEICTVATECKRALTGANGGQFQSTGGAAFDAAGNLWVADPANRRVQKFDAAGNFIAAYGHNVDKLGGSGGLEQCTSAAEGACQAGTQGSGAGQFSANNPLSIAIDDAGNLYAIDAGSKRVQKFDSTFTSATNFASSLFWSTAPHPEGGTVPDAIPEQVAFLEGANRLAFAVEKVTGFYDANPNEPLNPLAPTSERQVLELDPADGSLEETSLAGAGIVLPIEGLAADPAGRIYVTAESGPFPFSLFEVPGYLAGGPRQVLVLGSTPPPPPVLSMSPVTTTTDTSATFKATVDPKGGLLSCIFQYSTDQSVWTDVPVPGCNSLSTTGTQAISRAATGLDPNTHYFVRLQTFRPSLEGTTANSNVRAFDTGSTPPILDESALGAVQVTDASARLLGEIDPRHSATGYVFEYGTTPALGSSTAPLAIGDGTDPVSVSQVIADLKPDTTYYFRLVATNASGPSATDQKTFHTRSDPPPAANPGNCANEARRLEQSSAFLPDCRAYEMVTPTDKNQGGAAGRGLFGGEEAVASVSMDGEAVAFCTGSLFGEPAGQFTGACSPYLSRRGPGGWTTATPTPRYCFFDPTGGALAGQPTSMLSAQSFERIAAAIPEYAGCPLSPLLPGAALPSQNLYRIGLTGGSADLNRLNPNTTEGAVGVFFSGSLLGAIGGSDDFSHVVYAVAANQTPDSPPQDDFTKLYDWEEEGHGDCAQPGGCLSLVTVAPDGQPFESGSSLPGTVLDVASSVFESAVSTDGSRIYFHNSNSNPSFPAGHCGSPGCELYLRENSEETIHVSESECTEACDTASNSPDSFLWATPSGDKAFFLSCAKLTDASAAGKSCSLSGVPASGAELKLYRWDRDGTPEHRLIDLSVDTEPSDGTQPRALDVIGASRDESADPASNAAPGNTVYFIAARQLVSGAPASGGLKLYRWRWNNGGPSLEYLAPYVSSSDDGSPTLLVNDPNVDRLHVRTSADGRYLAIQTVLALDAAADRDSDADLYRWEEENGWLCVSCQLPGTPSAGHVSGFSPHLAFNDVFNELGGNVPEHTISDDGQRLFFTTPDALVPEDVNGEGGCSGAKPSNASFSNVVYTCQDVYEWHDGTLSLLTLGTGTRPFILIGATADAKNVTFATGQRLVGWDRDNSVDIYVARTDGGFAEPAPQPPICEGESCRGAGTIAAVTTGAGSAVFEGPGDVTRPPGRTCPKGKRSVTRKGKARCVTRGPRNRKGAQRKRRTANHDRRAHR